MVSRIRIALGRALTFIRRQKPNYRVGVMHSAGNSLLTGLTSQYNGIFAVALGADSVQLGSLTSIGSAIGALISIPLGLAVDRRGVRPFFLLGIALSGAGALLYALAGDWRILIVAAILAAVALRMNSTSCSVICADSVKNEDRATAQSVCGTLAASLSVLAPLLAATLVTHFGGINVQGMRPLYYLRFVGYGVIFAVVASRLREPRVTRASRTGDRWGLADARQIFAGRTILWKWIAVSTLSALPMAMF
ncbi:MAG: MFS transporter [Anaerolineae bacterium]